MSLDEHRITKLHQEAMRLAHQAVEAVDLTTAQSLFQEAFEKEQEAAGLLAIAFGVEPTRAILYRSAVALALRGERHRAGLGVLVNGLASRQPGVKEELRGLQGELSRSGWGRPSQAAEARDRLQRTWHPSGWRERIPEIVEAYLGKIDHYLQVSGFQVGESAEIAVEVFLRLYEANQRLSEISDLDLALFKHLFAVCRERRVQS
jgi:hypothetical protein